MMNTNKTRNIGTSKIRNERHSAGDNIEKKLGSVNVKKKGMARPAQTKSSMHRQNLAVTRRMQTVCVVPDEVLYCVFKYIEISDLLRCCCVSKTWKEVAEILILWEIQFKRLPKQVRDLSSKAKTTGKVNWKKECLFCVKERRQRLIKKLSKDTSIYSTKKLKVPLNRSLDIRWLLIFEDTTSNCYEVTATEDFVFNIGISIRWNELDIPPLSQMVAVKLYALTPLFFNENLKPEKNSICTRSLVMMHSFKDVPLRHLVKLCEDEHVSVHVLKKYLYFGLWKSSLPKEGNIAFIGMCAPTHGLVNITQHASSGRMYEIPKHNVVFDDVDSKYGLHGYFAVLELRNSRKSFLHEIYKEFNEGVWLDNILNIEHQRHKDFVFYDIKDKISFTWKTVALKGLIEDFLILDMNLYDGNQHLMWNFSSPVKLVKLGREQDNYSYEDGELWVIEKVDDCGKCIVELMKNTSTNESTILSVKFQLTKTFINEWFGTSY